MPSCFNWSCNKFIVSATTATKSVSTRLGLVGRTAPRKSRTIPSSRLISLRQTSAASRTFFASALSPSFSAARCKTCKCRPIALSGLPISCATPAASATMESIRSLSIRSSVCTFSVVTSLNTATRLEFSESFTEPTRARCRRRTRDSG